MAAAQVPDGGAFSCGELAAIAVARSLERISCELTVAERADLVDAYSERHPEWIVLGGRQRGRRCLVLARAASYSPASVDGATVAACSEGELSAAAIIEVITSLAVLRMLHRLTCFTSIAD